MLTLTKCAFYNIGVFDRYNITYVRLYTFLKVPVSLNVFLLCNYFDDALFNNYTFMF